jgi:hypothetical protein
MVACRPNSETIEPPPRAKYQRWLQHPRWSAPQRSLPKIVDDPHVVPPAAGPATATRHARTDPNAAFE